jgi:hypothetical protein
MILLHPCPLPRGKFGEQKLKMVDNIPIKKLVQQNLSFSVFCIYVLKRNLGEMNNLITNNIE